MAVRNRTSEDQAAALSELRNAYRDFIEFKRSSRNRIRREHLELAEEEIRAVNNEALSQFAKHLAETKEKHGFTIGQIQDEVLRTRSWRAWETLRDAAE